MASWKTYAQLTNNHLLEIGKDDKLWFCAKNFGDNVVVGEYQDTVHISSSSDVHLCHNEHIKNLKYATEGTAFKNNLTHQTSLLDV